MPRQLSAAASRNLAAELTSYPVFPVGADEGAALDRLATELATWLADAPRFRAFANAHREKIRKKLRLARDAGARRDVRAELLVARQLLTDRHVEIAFEPSGAARGGPDFAVTYRAGRPFNLEVTRPRRVAAATADRPILAKLRQLPTGSANVLVLALPAGEDADMDVASAVRAMRARADARDEGFLARNRFAGTRDFYDHLIRLGAVVTWPEGGAGKAWVNRSARIHVPDRGLEACLGALATPAALGRPME